MVFSIREDNAGDRCVFAQPHHESMGGFGGNNTVKYPIIRLRSGAAGSRGAAGEVAGLAENIVPPPPGC
jgi:hypothetical protein